MGGHGAVPRAKVVGEIYRMGLGYRESWLRQECLSY